MNRHLLNAVEQPLGPPIREPKPEPAEPQWQKTADGKYETRTVNGRQEVRSVDYEKRPGGWPSVPFGSVVSSYLFRITSEA